MKKLFWILPVILIISFIGCKKGPTGPAPEYKIEDYFPLAVGNEWVYEIKLYVDDSLESTDTLTMTITEIQQWNGMTVYKESFINYYVYFEDELRNYVGFPSDTTPYFVLLKEPLEEGNSWYFIPGLPDPINIIEIEDIDIRVSVPAGTFDNCIKCRLPFITPADLVWFYALEVGLVKQVLKFTEEGITVLELIEYEVH